MYRRFPQGLKISTAIFQRTVRKILSKHLYNKGLVCVDDLISIGDTFECQLNNLETILKELDEFNLKMNSQKSQFMYKKINLLGHEIQKKAIDPWKAI